MESALYFGELGRDRKEMSSNRREVLRSGGGGGVTSQ